METTCELFHEPRRTIARRCRILIVKTGKTETYRQDNGGIVSLGDILRTTPILRGLKAKYAPCHITWVVSPAGAPLLQGIKLIDRLVVWKRDDLEPLTRERFHLVVNLETSPDALAFTERLSATLRTDGWHRLPGTGEAPPRRTEEIFWQTRLFDALDLNWTGQEYVIGREADPDGRFDVGLNHEVGPKWPTKAMPMERWQALAARLVEMGYTVSWQRGFNDLATYIDWVASCRLLVTHDSLGLHLALALGKRVVGLFGPTDPRELFFYQRGEAITARSGCASQPCYRSTCTHREFCMGALPLDDVIRRVRKWLR